MRRDGESRHEASTYCATDKKPFLNQQHSISSLNTKVFLQPSSHMKRTRAGGKVMY